MSEAILLASSAREGNAGSNLLIMICVLFFIPGVCFGILPNIIPPVNAYQSIFVLQEE